MQLGRVDADCYNVATTYSILNKPLELQPHDRSVLHVMGSVHIHAYGPWQEHKKYHHITFLFSCLYHITSLYSMFPIHNTVNPERIASVIFNDFINPATLTSLYDNVFSKLCTCFT